MHIFDNDSNDGTADILPDYTCHIHRVPAGTYVPGRVLNEAMKATNQEAPFIVFLNSDCTPLNENWLKELVEGFKDNKVGAVFGRQLPRDDCHPLLRKTLMILLEMGHVRNIGNIVFRWPPLLYAEVVGMRSRSLKHSPTLKILIGHGRLVNEDGSLRIASIHKSIIHIIIPMLNFERDKKEKEKQMPRYFSGHHGSALF